MSLSGDGSVGTDTEITTSTTSQSIISFGIIPGAPGANRSGLYRIFIPDYTATSFHKIMHLHSMHIATDAATGMYFAQGTAVWKNTAPITSINFIVSNVAAGSTFTAYGML